MPLLTKPTHQSLRIRAATLGRVVAVRSWQPRKVKNHVVSLPRGPFSDGAVSNRSKTAGRREIALKRRSKPLVSLSKKTRSIPLHHQVFLVLQDGITESRYAPNEALPSEEELAKRFERPLRDIQGSVESLAGALTPAQNDVWDVAAKPRHPSSRLLAWWRTLRPARRAN